MSDNVKRHRGMAKETNDKQRGINKQTDRIKPRDREQRNRQIDGQREADRWIKELIERQTEIKRQKERQKQRGDRERQTDRFIKKWTETDRD